MGSLLLVGACLCYTLGVLCDCGIVLVIIVYLFKLTFPNQDRLLHLSFFYLIVDGWHRLVRTGVVDLCLEVPRLQRRCMRDEALVQCMCFGLELWVQYQGIN